MADILNTLDTDATLTIGEDFTSAFETTDYDEDYIKVDLEAGKTYAFELDVDNGNGYLNLLDSDGNYVWENTYYFYDNEDSGLVFTADSDGVYYIDAGGWAYNDDGASYTLKSKELNLSPDNYADNIDDAVVVDLNTDSSNGVLYSSKDILGDYSVINNIGDNDYYKVTLSAGQSYVISAGSNFDVEVLDSNGNYVWNNNIYTVWGDDTKYVVITPPEDTTYYLDVRGGYELENISFDNLDNNLGSYDLTIKLPENDAVGNNIQNAADFEDLDTNHDGILDSNDDNSDVFKIDNATDIDFYKFDVKNGDQYIIDATSDETDLVIQGVYDNNGNYIDGTFNDDYNGLNPESTFTATSDGEYYVAVRSWNGETGNYSLSIKVNNIQDNEADNTSTTTEVENGVYTGSIDYAYDDDWIKVNLNANTSYRIDLTGDTLSDTVIEGVYDSDGNLIPGTYNDDYNGLNSHIDFIPEESGTYYISVAGFADNTGTYTLSVSENGIIIDDHPNSISGVTDSDTIEITNGYGTIQGELNTTFDEDYFKVHLNEGETYTINLESDDYSFWPYLDILDSNGNYVWENITYNYSYDDTTIKSSITITPTENDDYYLRVEGWQTGDYTIEILQQGEDDHPNNINGDFSNSTFDLSNSDTQTIGGVFETYNDTDMFKLEVEDGYAYMIKITSDDSYLYPNVNVLDSNGAYEWNNLTYVYDFDSSNLLESFVFTPQNAGEYYIELDGYGTGNYSIEVDKIQINTQDDHPDSISGVTDNDVINIDDSTHQGSASGVINNYTDEDYFKLHVSAGETYTISVDNPDVYIDLMENDPYWGEEYIWNVNYSWNNGEVLTYTADSDEDIYIRVSGYGVNENYNLTVNEVVDDHPNSIYGNFDNSSIIDITNLQDSYSGKIDTTLDDDYFKLTNVQAGDVIEIIVNNNNSSNYVYANILDSDGNYLWDVNYVWDDNNEHFYFTAEESGDYYLDVYGWDNDDYTITVNKINTQDDHPDSISGVTDNDVINIDDSTHQGSASGVINNYTDEDYFKLHVSAGETYTISVDNPDVYIDLMENDPYWGEEYIWNVNYSWNNGEVLTYTADSDEDIYIRVSGYGVNENYNLTVNEVTQTDDHPNSINSTFTSDDIINLVSNEVQVDGQLENYWDNDYFKVTLQAGHTYQIDLDSDNTYPWFDIYDSNGNGVWNIDYNWSTNSIESVTFSVTDTDVYYIDVYGGEGNYTLNIRDITTQDDYSDDIHTVGAVNIGETTTGKLENYNDVDWIKVRLEAGKTYKIDAMSDEVDMIINGIYDSEGNYIDNTWDDDDGQGLNARTYLQVEQTGDYYISVSGYSTGDYTIGVTDITINDNESDDTSTTASVSIGGVYNGNIDYQYDKDFIKVDLQGGNTYTISLTGLTLDDTVIEGIYDSNGNYIDGTYNDDYGFSLDSQITFTPTEDGIYYIEVGGFDSDTGSYSLTVTKNQNNVSSNVDSFNNDINNTIDSAIALSVGESQQGTIDYNGDVDYYKVHLEAGKTYDIQMLGSDSDNGTLIDPLIEGILDSNGNYIEGTYADDNNGTLDSDLVFTPTESGDYYIEATSWDGLEGTYQIKVNEKVNNHVDNIDTVNKGDLTIMVYIAADNNLAPFALEDINEMEAANLGNNVHVTFLLDGSDTYGDSDYSSTYYGLINHDDDTSNISSQMIDVGEKDTGDAQTLTDFINWSVNTAPADNYALVVWDHGGGIAGTSWDESSDSDNLSIDELQTAINNSSVNHFDMIGFDACLEGVLDSAYSLKNNADYVVASENTEPGDGWDYTTWLNSVANENKDDESYKENIAKDAVTSYGNYYENVDGTTMSAIDTSKLDTIVNDLKNFNDALSLLSSNQKAQLEAKLDDAPTYGIWNEYVDLGQLAKIADEADFNDKTDDNGKTFDDYAHQLYQDIIAQDGIVVANFSESGNDTGISIYDPGYVDYDYIDNFEIAQLTNIDDLYQL